jgi:hypothetical protein
MPRDHPANLCREANQEAQAMNIPPKLQRVIKAHKGIYHKIADALGVNPRYVYDYLKFGKEPTDRTPTGRQTRAKMFLPKRRNTQRAERQPMPEWLIRLRRNIRRQVKETHAALRSHLP